MKILDLFALFNALLYWAPKHTHPFFNRKVAKHFQEVFGMNITSEHALRINQTVDMLHTNIVH